MLSTESGLQVITQDDLHTTIKRLATVPKPLNQTSNVIVFAKNANGTAEMSLLSHFEEGDSIVLHTICEDGTTRSETLSRLPVGLRSCDVVLIGQDSGVGNDEVVRFVLNRQGQNYYSFSGDEKSTLPAMLVRTRKSIPTFLGTHKGLQPQSQENIRLKRRKLIHSDNSTVP